jgi:hypothetical protein
LFEIAVEALGALFPPDTLVKTNRFRLGLLVDFLVSLLRRDAGANQRAFSGNPAVFRAARQRLGAHERLFGRRALSLRLQ